MSTDGLLLDREIRWQEVQGFASSDAIAGFFANLGYKTDVRTQQSPANLGITAEGTVRPIKKIELIADQEGFFQVYLFELTSVTVSHTRALASAFRNRAGNYLFVLTSDYEKLDFVLIEKFIPSGLVSSKGISQRQIGVRPRSLTADRRKPDPIHLRVLRRFTYTEADPFAQYDKLLSAYAIADWSEKYFNNRALFSDYYLVERLKSHKAWTEDPKPTYLALQTLYREASKKYAGKEEEYLRTALLEPVFSELGFKAIAGKPADSTTFEPDYRLWQAIDLAKSGPQGSANGPLALCLTYPWGRSLDGKDEQRDTVTPEENPGAVVVSLLERGEAPWAVVTNGKIWRLYSAKAHSRATNYYEIDLEEALTISGPHAGDPAEAFRYFWLLFRRQAFEPSPMEREGREQTLSFLDLLMVESEDYAKELGERLKEKTFEEVFPHLAKGFITYIRQQKDETEDISQGHLDEIFQGTLTFLYRLLFTLYAEARDLLPVREARGYYEASLAKLKREVADNAGPIEDQAEKNLKKHYRDDQYNLYDRIQRLVQVVDKGDSTLNVPVYNGGLFLSEPSPEDFTPEAKIARFLLDTKVPDLYLSRAMDLLARDLDPKRHDLVFIDYKSLGVRQLGSIYEGLLEFRLRIAPEKMAIVKGKRTEEVVPYRETRKKKLKILTKGRGRDAKERTYKKGEIYLENDKRERRATGSYYTPEHIVKHLVENAVGPVCREKFEAIRPKLRRAQIKRNEFFKRREAFRKKGLKPEPESKADLIGRELVDELFDLKVLDPAMGSGHFLVEAVDYITDKAIDFLNSFPWNPIFVHLEKTRETILREMDQQGITIDVKRLTDVNLLKRHVLKRCLYGVDLNPMAVELTKVSLWLDCFTLGAPLSFLDHHLRCGNSLVGVTVDEVREAVEPVTKYRTKKKTAATAHEWKVVETTDYQFTLFGSRFAGLKLAVDLMRRVGTLSDVTSQQVRESRTQYCKAFVELEPFKRILDVYISKWFGNGVSDKAYGRAREPETQAVSFLKSSLAEPFLKAIRGKDLQKALGTLSSTDREIAETSLKAAAEKRFFHWELEFPEVFYGPRPGTKQVIEKLDGAGFDVVIGNPPYDEPSQYYSGTTEVDKTFLSDFESYRHFKKGRVNLYRLFIIRAFELLKENGRLGYIVPMTLLADEFSRLTREFLLYEKCLAIVEAFPQKDNPKRRVFPEAKLSTCAVVVINSPECVEMFVRTHPGRYIENESPSYKTKIRELSRIFPTRVVLPTVSVEEYLVIQHAFAKEDWPRLSDVANIYVGEVFDNAPNKKFLSDEEVGPLVLRGANIDRYMLRETPRQGKKRYLREQLFRRKKRRATKLKFVKRERIGLQRGAAVDNWRRLIGCLIPPGHYSFDTVLLLVPDRIDALILLGLVNSDLWEWRFRCTSTTNHVNEYELADLIVPPCLLDRDSQEYKCFHNLVQTVLKSSRGFVRRSDCQTISSDSEDFQLDSLVFQIYGVGNYDIEVVQTGLRR